MPETPESSYQYGVWTVTKLKEELRNRNLSPSGNKPELIARLERAESGNSSPEVINRHYSPTKPSPEVIRTATPDGKDAARMKVNDLREELLSLGMSPIGKKSDLVQRLKEARNPANPFMDRLKVPAVESVRSQSRGRSRSSSRTPRRSVKQPSVSPSRRKNAAVMTEKDIGLMTSPLTTLYLAFKCGMSVAKKTFNSRRKSILLLNLPLIAIILISLLFVSGPHEKYTAPVREWLMWYGRWIFLGILSSVGLGTGAHTFLLFLGPFIARASTAAHVCKTLEFPLRGPSALLCPTESYQKLESISIISLFLKIKWEAFAWGVGTAIGELPPYIIAPAVAGRSAGHLSRVERLARKQNRSWAQSLQLASFRVISKLGFLGILLLASIPNPLFDLAGIMSGYFMIPFATFFSALFVGKAIVKSSLQAIFVIFLFSRDYLEQSFEFIKTKYPLIASHFSEWIVAQRAMFQERKPDPMIEAAGSIWHIILIAMMGYFVLSVIHSAAVMEAKKQGLLKKVE